MLYSAERCVNPSVCVPHSRAAICAHLRITQSDLCSARVRSDRTRPSPALGPALPLTEEWSAGLGADQRFAHEGNRQPQIQRTSEFGDSQVSVA
jgi:hypothetical protein